MTEANCDAYVAKIVSIKSACENPLTTLAALQTLLSDLSTINTNIETDIASMAFPTSVSHLNAYILVQIERARKANLHVAVLGLVRCREANMDTFQASNTYEDTIAYSEDNRILDDYVENTLIESCPCMKGRKNVVKLILKKKK